MDRPLCDQVMMNVSSRAEDSADYPGALLAHIEHCPDCRALLETKSAVRQLLHSVRMDPIAKRRLEIRILARTRVRETGDRPLYRRISVFVTAAFSLVWLLSVGLPIFFPMPLSSSNEGVGTASLSVAVHSETARPSPPEPVVTQATEGVAHNESLVLSQGAALWMKKGTDMEILNDTEKLAKTRVKTGRIIVDIRRHPTGFRFVVETPSAEVEALGTVFSVDVSSLGEETVRVVESAVVVRPKNGGEPSVVRAGEQLVLGISETAPADDTDLERDLQLVRSIERPGGVDSLGILNETAALIPSSNGPAESPATLSLTERAAAAIEGGAFDEAERLLRTGDAGTDNERMRLLFKLAGAYRSLGKYDRTVAVYEQLVSAYPGRDAAVNTLVSIAQIKQGFLKDPAGAMFYYDKYLRKRPHGVLSEAASAGKVRALFTLRQWQDVIEASDIYLQDFPSGISVSEVVQKRTLAKKHFGEVL